jgi:signal transduction histidine kinase
VNAAALRLPARVLGAQFATGTVLLGVLTLVGPVLLLLDGDVARAPIEFALRAAAPLGAIGFLLVRAKLRRSRFTLRTIALDSPAIEPSDVARLSTIPVYVTLVSIALVAGTVVIFVATPLRPPPLDFDTALSLALLGVIIVATGALPLYVSVRAAVARVLELVPPDATVGLLERAESDGRAERRLVWRVLLATATPVGFIAVASALIAHAHVRKFDAEARERTAEVVARIALEPHAGAVAEAGQSEAIAAARDLGFSLSHEHGQLAFAVERGEDGRVSMTMPLEEGAARVRFAVTAVQPMTSTDAWITLAAVGLAAALGLGLGRSLSRDLAKSTERVRALGTEQVLRGDPRVDAAARYTQVVAFNLAIETLAGRFRVFARAQERALNARDAAQKLRSLLFASVSHDLKSPLNSILGFASLVGQKPLSPPQRESLGFIEQSGRELLALIETILDTAKVDAGKMSLTRSKISVTAVIDEAIKRVRTLSAARPLEFEVDVPDEVPSLVGDESRLVQAFTTLMWYSARSGEPVFSAEGTVRPVRVAIKPVPGRRWLSVDIEMPSSAVAPEELTQLLSPEPWDQGRRRYGGLSLGLTLARALVELHRGRLRIKRTTRGTPLFEVLLPSTFSPFKSSPAVPVNGSSPANGAGSPT